MRQTAKCKKWLTICALAIGGCATNAQRTPQPPVCPALPAPSAEMMAPRKADFLQRVQKLLFESPETLTP